MATVWPEMLDMPAPDHRTLLACDYALINPLQVKSATWQDLPVTPLVPRGYEGQPELFPLLLPLGQLDQNVRVDLLNRQQAWERDEGTPWFSALLFARLSEARIRQHLCDLMPLRLLDGNHGCLRFHDPRTSQHMAWLLTAEQRDQWLGPIDRWCWRNPDRTWHYVERQAPAMAPLRLSHEQLATVERMGEINLVLAELSRVAPETTASESAARSIDTLLAEAWQVQRLAQRDDRLLYAEQGMRYGDDIHKHAALTHCLNAARDGNSTYAGACSEFDDAAMQRMARELHNHKECP